MALTDDQKLAYIVPLVVYSSADLDTDMANLNTLLQTDAQTAFNNGMVTVQPQIEQLLGHALTPDQLLAVRKMVADKLNQSLRMISITP